MTTMREVYEGTQRHMLREDLLELVYEHETANFTFNCVEYDPVFDSYSGYTADNHRFTLSGDIPVHIRRTESPAEKRVIDWLEQSGIAYEELYPVAHGWQIEAYTRKSTLQRKLEEAGGTKVKVEQGYLEDTVYSTASFVPPCAAAKDAIEQFISVQLDYYQPANSHANRCAALTDALLCIGNPDRARLWLAGYGKDAGAIYAAQQLHESPEDCLNRMVMAEALNGTTTPPSWLDIAQDLQLQLEKANQRIVSLTNELTAERQSELTREL